MQSLKRHYNTAHSATMTHYICRWCDRKFIRKDSAKRHLSKEHGLIPEIGLITEETTPRELAEPVKKWTPPIEATRRIDWTKPPVFNLISGKSKYSQKKEEPEPIDLTEDLYISSDDEEEIVQPYPAVTWETAQNLQKYSGYAGLEEFQDLPNLPPYTGHHGIDENHIVKCYRTRKQ